MNNRFLFLPALCLAAVTLTAGCAYENQPPIPDAGRDTAIFSPQIESARDNALDYVASASRLAALPADVDWQPDLRARSNGEYRFISGDWSMIVWPAGSGGGNQRVVIINHNENVFWCGYVKPGGDVVDTAYIR